MPLKVRQPIEDRSGIASEVDNGAEAFVEFVPVADDFVFASAESAAPTLVAVIETLSDAQIAALIAALTATQPLAPEAEPAYPIDAV